VERLHSQRKLVSAASLLLLLLFCCSALRCALLSSALLCSADDDNDYAVYCSSFDGHGNHGFDNVLVDMQAMLIAA
jgi:hypothetical protein